MMKLLIGIKGYAIAAGAFILALVALFYRGKSAGKEQVRTEVLIAKSKATEKANVVENKVKSMPDDDVNKRLRGKWSRD